MQRIGTSAPFAAGFTADARSALFLYEACFTEAPDTFDSLATALGGTLTEAQREILFAATRRSKIEEKISRLEQLPTAWRNPADGDLLDRDTQWHRHHAGRSGESGRWRQALTPPEVAQTERQLADFMRKFGYPGE